MIHECLYIIIADIHVLYNYNIRSSVFVSSVLKSWCSCFQSLCFVAINQIVRCEFDGRCVPDPLHVLPFISQDLLNVDSSLAQPAEVVGNEVQVVATGAAHQDHPALVGLLGELPGTAAATHLAGVHHLHPAWDVAHTLGRGGGGGGRWRAGGRTAIFGGSGANATTEEVGILPGNSLPEWFGVRRRRSVMMERVVSAGVSKSQTWTTTVFVVVSELSLQ